MAIKTLGGRKLGRKYGHRMSTLRNMVASLLLHEKVQTPVAKAKELKRIADRVITQAKKADHRGLRVSIQDKAVYRKLIEVLAPRYAGRASGFCQMYRLERRRGDNAEIALVKLVS